jgi:hypothetical protein
MEPGAIRQYAVRTNMARIISTTRANSVTSSQFGSAVALSGETIDGLGAGETDTAGVVDDAVGGIGVAPSIASRVILHIGSFVESLESSA